LGIVLAVAFLIAGLASTIDRQDAQLKPREQAVPTLIYTRPGGGG
jgi:hypothetical protein